MCLTDDAVVALLDGRLPAREAAAVHAHTAGCPRCRQLVAEAARLRHPAEERTGPAEEWPADPELTLPDALRPGATLGRYTILERIGSGGMGTVYAARDPELGRKVALKVISPTSRVGVPELRQRLLREAQAMARVSHPNVTVVHEVGTVGAQVFLAMEYVEGSTLRQWLARAPRSWSEVLAIFLQAGRGLAAAHAQGLVHRDFKPDNVLLGTDGRARVADFGLVRPTLGGEDGPRPDGLERPLTQVGTLLGTPGYMAPEQLRGKVPDARADQFAFCVALYEALHKVRPFGGDNIFERLRCIEHGELTPPPTRDGVPERLDAALRRGLLAESSRRFPSMEALLAALERAVPRPRPSRAAVAAMALGAVVALAGGGWLVTRATRAGAGAGLAADGCAPAGERLARAWGESRRAGVPERFAVGAVALDAYASHWEATRAEVCGAARADPSAAEKLPSRLECLDRALAELDDAGDALSRGVRGSLRRVRALPEPSACLEVTTAGAAASPEDPIKASLMARLEEVLGNGPGGPEQDAELRALSAECAAARQPAVRSRVLLALGRNLRAEGDLAGAQDSLGTALAAAQFARDDEAVARAGFELAGVLAASGVKLGEARRLMAIASAAAMRVRSMSAEGATPGDVPASGDGAAERALDGAPLSATGAGAHSGAGLAAGDGARSGLATPSTGAPLSAPGAAPAAGDDARSGLATPSTSAPLSALGAAPAAGDGARSGLATPSTGAPLSAPGAAPAVGDGARSGVAGGPALRGAARAGSATQLDTDLRELEQHSQAEVDRALGRSLPSGAPKRERRF